MKQNLHSVALVGEVVTRRERDNGSSPHSVVLHSGKKRRSVAPVVSIPPEAAQAIIDAAECDRDRLLITVLWQTGCRVSEALALRGQDIEPDSLWLRNLKNGPDEWKQVPLPAGSTLTADLALWQKAAKLPDDAPLFRSRLDRQLSRYQAWRVVKAASERAGVTVRALRSGGGQQRGDRVPVWSHVFRHSRALQTIRHADPVVAQQVLGHRNLQTTSRYLRYDQDELKRRVRQVPT